MLLCGYRMKTITLDDEAYHILAARKVGHKDSFSRVVKSHFEKSTHVLASAGTWKDMTSSEAARICETTVKAFEARVGGGSGGGRRSRLKRSH